MLLVQFTLHTMGRTMGDFRPLGNKAELLEKILSMVFLHQEQLLV